MTSITKYVSSREEAILVLVGMTMIGIIAILYLWGVGTLTESLRTAVGGARIQQEPKIEFDIAGAETLLQGRGLLQ